jgi:catechol 2,3-dioxygenase-like lactoylglutathione lyase family enzyme
MAATSSAIGTGALPWREIHHLALATRDLEATIRFYTDVLGMHAADIAPANPIHGRTCTIKPSPNATSELHFFEHADAQPIQLHPERNRGHSSMTAGDRCPCHHGRSSAGG